MPTRPLAALPGMTALRNGSVAVFFLVASLALFDAPWFVVILPVVVLGLLAARAVARMMRSLQLAQERLLREREHARGIIDSSMTCIIGTDANRRIIEFNKAAETTYGYTLEEVRGLSVDRLYADPAQAEHVGREILTKGFFAGEVTSRKKNGEPFPVMIAASLLRDSDGNVYGSVGNSRDLTGERQAARALAAKESAELANQAKSRLLANMSHDIRTPMNAVIGMSELLLDMENDPVKRGHLGIVLHSARSLLGLINDILDLSKIESGRMVLERIPFDWRQVMEETIATLDIAARRKGLALTLEADPALPSCLEGDPTRLRQVLMNLAGNAIKFTRSGQVTLSVQVLSATPEACRLRCAVRDTGIGIPEDRLEAIFESFTQADVSTTRCYGGTGLGVTIAREIVARMGGRLQVVSRVGEGSTFHFEVTLPVAPDGNCRMRLSAAAMTESPQRLFTVLLVEDMEANATLAVLRLERQGHRVLVANDGLEALAAWERGGVDLILMDVQMPNMDGLTATRTIREREAARGDGRRIPIVAMTAAAMKGDQEACLEAGMDGYVSKPIEFVRLAAVMEEVAPPGVGRVATEEPQAGMTEMEGEDLPPEWRGLAGIDAVTGLAKWGNAEVYRGTLIGFGRKHATDGATLRDALARGDLQAAKALAHALKGAAGTMAATGLESAAVALDTALRQRKEEQGDMNALLASLAKRHLRLEDLVADFERALEVVIASCRSLEPPDREHPGVIGLVVEGDDQEERHGRLDPHAVERLCALAHSLSLGDISSVEEGLRFFQESRVLRQAELDRLLELADDLELEQALTLVREMAGGLGVDLGV
ncbi:MAG: response regulator [Magnetococcales bacterium]|nr:response regulator [Magnetococcales bacterium]